jgi:hypothetical protein
MAGSEDESINVRYWRKADIDFDAEHVCFRGTKRTSPIRDVVSANDP